jgi:hypothetical protein
MSLAVRYEWLHTVHVISNCIWTVLTFSRSCFLPRTPRILNIHRHTDISHSTLCKLECWQSVVKENKEKSSEAGLQNTSEEYAHHTYENVRANSLHRFSWQWQRSFLRQGERDQRASLYCKVLQFIVLKRGTGDKEVGLEINASRGQDEIIV